MPARSGSVEGVQLLVARAVFQEALQATALPGSAGWLLAVGPQEVQLALDQMESVPEVTRRAGFCESMAIRQVRSLVFLSVTMKFCASPIFTDGAPAIDTFTSFGPHSSGSDGVGFALADGLELGEALTVAATDCDADGDAEAVTVADG